MPTRVAWAFDPRTRTLPTRTLPRWRSSVSPCARPPSTVDHLRRPSFEHSRLGALRWSQRNGGSLSCSCRGIEHRRWSELIGAVLNGLLPMGNCGGAPQGVRDMEDMTASSRGNRMNELRGHERAVSFRYDRTATTPLTGPSVTPVSPPRTHVPPPHARPSADVAERETSKGRTCSTRWVRAPRAAAPPQPLRYAAPLAISTSAKIERGHL